MLRTLICFVTLLISTVASAQTGVPLYTIAREILTSTTRNPSNWVLDIGFCNTATGGATCKSTVVDPLVGETVLFNVSAPLATAQTPIPTAQVDVSVGRGHSLSRGEWDLSIMNRITFFFRDLDADAGSANKLHYFLVYDEQPASPILNKSAVTRCYRSWLLDGTTRRLDPGKWYEVNAILRGDASTYYMQGGYTATFAGAGPYVPQGTSVTPISGSVPPRCLNQPLDFSRIIYFEVGEFGSAIQPGVQFRFQVGSVTTSW